MVAFIYDPIFLEHDTGAYHPETAERLRSILHRIEPLKERLLRLEPIAASEAMLRSVHTAEHIERIESASRSGASLDADTPTSERSYEAALKAVGAGLVAVDAVAAGKVHAAFAAVRPPGHHATAERAMGFCLFNNIAITARYAQECGYERVMIVDFDVHHGNGTQELFYDDPTVFYFSTHQYPAYPGSGSREETGIGEGEGYTLNFPLLPGSGGSDIVPIYEEALPEAAARFLPDIILVSAGYDLHCADPLAGLCVTTEGIGDIVRCIMECSPAPKLFFLEGGYNLEVLGECVATTIAIMLASEQALPGQGKL
jgi:acetoin utilization deacetylase AcuC-like enzyme